MAILGVILAIFGFLQISAAASLPEDKYEPMVAFICERPAMHRGVNAWIPDRSTGCLDRMEDILSYCQKVYPDHNITNVVEASYLVTISDWPMVNSERLMPHRVRPYRCLVGPFQSAALLVPRHCEFDHRHDQSICDGFEHWNRVADDACHMKGYHLESFGMLLSCEGKVGHFSGVEYVCCPNKPEETQKPVYHPPQQDDKPDASINSEQQDNDDDSYGLNEDTVDLYEAYLRGEPFPSKYSNEHKKFLAAKQRMKQDQQLKVTKLLQEWQTAREHVDTVRKTDPRKADRLAEEITERFQNLYSSYEQENQSELQQLIGLHLQHVQAIHNERKRRTMDNYLRAFESGNADEIVFALRAYIEAEEKDRMHTVNHYEHVKANSAKEALRIRPFILNHLNVSEQRIDQALEMLSRLPKDVQASIKPEIEDFMGRFNPIAKSIQDVVLPVPVVEETDPVSESVSSEVDSASYSKSDSSDDYFDESSDSDSYSDDDDDEEISDEEEEDESVDEEVTENEHNYQQEPLVANRMDDSHILNQNLRAKSVRSTKVSSTLGFALGGVSLFVIILVAVVMVIRRRNNTQFVSHSYVEVDPNAPQEERHIANMQMNGYENPTYILFEQSQRQTNPTA